MISFFYHEHLEKALLAFLFLDSILLITKPFIKLKKGETITLEANKQKRYCLINSTKKLGLLILQFLKILFSFPLNFFSNPKVFFS